MYTLMFFENHVQKRLLLCDIYSYSKDYNIHFPLVRKVADNEQRKQPYIFF